MKKQKSEKINYGYIASLLLVIVMLFGLLWLFDRPEEPTPVGASAAGTCDRQELLKGIIVYEVGHTPDSAIKQNEKFTTYLRVDLGSKDSPCYDSKGIKFRFVYQISGAASQTSRSTFVTPGYGVHPVTKNDAFDGEFSASWDELFPDETFSSGVKTEVYADVFLDGTSVHQTSLDTINIVAAGSGGGGNTNNSNQGNQNTPKGNQNTNTPKGNQNNSGGGGSSSGGGDCGKYFKLDPQTGLCNPVGIGADGSLAKSGNVYDLASRIIKVMLTFAGIIAVIFVIIGGYQYITSAGNEEQAGKGRKTITYALIGLIVILLSFLIVSLVTRFVTSSGT